MLEEKKRICWPVVVLLALGILVGLFSLFYVPTAVAAEGEGEPVVNGEPTLQPGCWFINDPEAAWKAGHAAVIICDGTGYYYYSYGPSPKYGPKGLITAIFPSLQAAFAYAKAGPPNGDPINTYTRYLHWACNAPQATAARTTAQSYSGTPYDLTDHNCWNMVYEAIHAAVGGRIYNWGPVPNWNYLRNLSWADDHGGI
jgi:hypothetical protein